MMTRSMARRGAAAAALVITLSGLAGCYTEGGPMMSIDQATYVSYPHEPKTVVLKDTRLGEEIWTYELPVGQKLVINFQPGKGDDNLVTPDLMVWDVMPKKKKSGSLRNRMPVPDARSRAVEWRLRAETELPDEMITPAAPLIIEEPPPAGPGK